MYYQSCSFLFIHCAKSEFHYYIYIQSYGPVCTNIHCQPLIQEWKLTQLLKLLFQLSFGSLICTFHGPKEFTKNVKVLGLTQLKQWFYNITPRRKRILC